MTDVKTGETLFSEGKVEEAEKCFLDLLKKEPTNAEAINDLGVIQHAKGNLQEAEDLFLKALAFKKDFLDALLNLADLYQNTKRWGDAAIQLKKCIAVKTQEPNFYNQLGIVYFEMGNIEKARDSLEKSLKINPDQEEIRSMVHSLEENKPGSKARNAENNQGRIIITEKRHEIKGCFSERSDDVYLKQVPLEKQHLKTGMNICIMSDFNIAGALTSLMRGINKYSEHKARCIIWHDDHFSYDKDIILDECNNDFDEAVEIVNKADFFHFGRYVFNFPGIDFNKILNPRNCVVKYYGSFLRENGKACNEWHRKTGIAAITGTDFTITPLLDKSFYHMESYFTSFGDMDEEDIPLAEKPNGTVRIAGGSAGSPRKRYDLLQKAVKELQGQGLPVEVEIIKGVSNEECLRRKQKCHITFTSLTGGWGLSGVESMWLGHPVMSCIDPFLLSLYPDQPTVIIDQDNLLEQIKRLVVNPEKIIEIGTYSREFVKKHFRTKDIIKRYLYLFDLIMNHDLYSKGGSKASRIYTF